MIMVKHCDVLFCATPNISLWRRYPFIEAPFGSSLVVGGLVQKGFSVEYLDLNLLFNHWQKGERAFSSESMAFLEKWEDIPENLDGLPNDVQQVFDRISRLVSKYEFKFAALSLNRVTVDFSVFNATFGFAVILSHMLKSKFGCCVILGGQVLRMIGLEKILSEINKSKVKYADYFFEDDGAVELPAFLKAPEGIKNQRVLHWKEVGDVVCLGSTDKKRRLEKDLIKIKPSFNIVGSKLYNTSFDKILPSTPDLPWSYKPISIMPYKFIYGCSNKCAFCKAAYEKLVIKKPVDVASDLESLVKKEGITCFRFFNSQINFSNKYVKELCREIIKRKLNIIFSDSASFRNLSREICDLLREAGCVKLWFGLESPNDRILKAIEKELKLAEAENGLMSAHKAGIWVGINIIVGFPHETEEDFNNLCKFIERYKDVVNCWSFSSLEVHQQTPLFTEPKHYGISIHHKYSAEEGCLGYAFSEIGGLDWNERRRMADIKADKCYQMLSPSRHRFYSNDMLIFALYREFRQKKDVKKQLEKYIKEIKKKTSLSLASKWVNYKNVHFDEVCKDAAQ